MMIRCWFIRRIVSAALDDGACFGPRVTLHLQSCASCRGFQREQQVVVARLKADGKDRDGAFAPLLHGRIMAAVRRAESQAGPAREPVWVPGAWAAGLASIALAALGIVAGVEAFRTVKVSPRPDLAAEVFEVSGEELLVEATGRDLEAWSRSLDGPLDTELHLVMNDARVVVDSFADRFLPPAYHPLNTATAGTR